MSKKSTLREALAKQEETRVARRGVSSSPTVKAVLRGTQISRPVQVALELTNFGLSLRRAHDVSDQLARGEEGSVALSRSASKISVTLSLLGISISPIRRPNVDVREGRAHSKLSQYEFALQYGRDAYSQQRKR